MTDDNPTAYVTLAIKAIEVTNDHDELLLWWKEELPNRRKWRLSPDQDPGLKLKEAFDLKRSQLKGTSNESV